MIRQIRPRQNALGPGGWLWAGRYRLERYLYTLHRITGLGLLLACLAYLAVMTVFQLQGRDVWGATLLFVHSRWFGIIVILFVFHALNGLRLSLQEIGFTLGQPAPPAYPYRDSLRKNRLLTAAMTAVIMLLSSLFLIIFFIMGVW